MLFGSSKSKFEVGSWVALGLQAGQITKADRGQLAVNIGGKSFWRKPSDLRPLFGSSGRPKKSELVEVGDWVRLPATDKLGRPLSATPSLLGLSLKDGEELMGQVSKVDAHEGRLRVQLLDGRSCWRAYDQVLMPDDDAPYIPLQVLSTPEKVRPNPALSSTQLNAAAGSSTDAGGAGSSTELLSNGNSSSSGNSSGKQPVSRLRAPNFSFLPASLSSSRPAQGSRRGLFSPQPTTPAESFRGVVREAAEKSGLKISSPLGRKGSRTKLGLWADSIIRSSVLDSEIAKPGGLEGGPGEIKPSDIHALLETRWGRKLTPEEKKFANQRLSYNIMQLEPPSRVRSTLYLGNAYNAVNFWELKSLGITHVLNLCAEDRFDPPSSYEASGITCHRIPLTDQPSQPIYEHFENAINFLRNCKNQGHSVLVHCEYGVSRSGTIMIAYLMESERMNLKRALEAVRSVRPQVGPNPGFMRALVLYERNLFGSEFGLITETSKGVAYEGLLRVDSSSSSVGAPSATTTSSSSFAPSAAVEAVTSWMSESFRAMGIQPKARDSNGWASRWVEVRSAHGSDGPRLIVYSSMNSFDPVLTIPLEGAQVTPSTDANVAYAWQISVASSSAMGAAPAPAPSGTTFEMRYCSTSAPHAVPAPAYIFAAEDSTDAERWLSACKQQTGLPLDQLDLTPRISEELHLHGFLKAEERANIIAPSEIQLGRQLGTGFYGAVYEGRWRGAKVALKFCAADAQPNKKSEFRVELVRESALHHILDHPNVIKWHGMCIGHAPSGWPGGLQPPCACVELAQQTFLELLKATPRDALYRVDYWTNIARILEGGVPRLGVPPFGAHSASRPQGGEFAA